VKIRKTLLGKHLISKYLYSMCKVLGSSPTITKKEEEGREGGKKGRREGKREEGGKKEGRKHRRKEAETGAGGSLL
jgi:hypothetical protein